MGNDFIWKSIIDIKPLNIATDKDLNIEQMFWRCVATPSKNWVFFLQLKNYFL